jgi:acetolactate synthase-1/2/3 large subunit
MINGLNNFKELYKIEYDSVIKDDLFPTKDGLTMGEVIKEINNYSQRKCCSCH